VESATVAGPNPVEIILPQMHRVRIVGRGDRELIQDFVPAQAGVSGQSRYTGPQLVAPVIIEPDEQIAVDLGYDQAEGTAAATILPQAFIFFCLKIKDKLTAQDEEAAKDIRRAIEAEKVQRRVFYNCVALGNNAIGLDFTSAAGATVNCITSPTNIPVLITGIGTNLQASRLTIIDTYDGSSFSLNRPMQSSALNLPGYENSDLLATAGAPVVGPLWTGYFQLPVPHLLRRGAQLQAQIVNSGDAGAGPGTVTEQGEVTQLVFQGVTV